MVRAGGRPRSFDADEMLRRIYSTFRKGGFSGTSLDTIASDTGLARPSLYAAFGDKRAMYLKVLSLVAEDIDASADRLEGAGLPLRATLERWFAGCVEAYTVGESGPGGCLAICTAAAETVSDGEIRTALHQVLERIDVRIRRWFERAGADAPAEKAQLCAALMHSLSLRARSGEPPERLNALWKGALDVIVPAGTRNA